MRQKNYCARCGRTFDECYSPSACDANAARQPMPVGTRVIKWNGGPVATVIGLEQDARGADQVVVLFEDRLGIWIDDDGGPVAVAGEAR